MVSGVIAKAQAMACRTSRRRMVSLLLSYLRRE
jgi:hypothetical protein